MTRSEFLLHGKDLPVKRILATPGKSPLTRISKLTYTSRQGPNTLSWHRVKVDDKLFYHNHARKKPYDQNLEPRDEECQFLQQAGAVALIRAMPGTSEVHSQDPWPEESWHRDSSMVLKGHGTDNQLEKYECGPKIHGRLFE